MTTETQAPDPAQPAPTYVRKKPHFYYDPECGVLWFATEAEALAYAAESLKCFAKDARHDGEWPSEVEDVRIGVATHATAEIGNDDDGYDYKVVPLQAAIPASEGADEAAAFEAWYEQERTRRWLRSRCDSDRGPVPSENWCAGLKSDWLAGWQARAALGITQTKEPINDR